MIDKKFADYVKAGQVPLPNTAVTAAKSHPAAAGAAVLLPLGDRALYDNYNAPEQAMYQQNGIADKLLHKLRRQPADTELDLHGMTVTEAHEALTRFLGQAQQQRWRTVEIIHGRGLHGDGVLRGCTRYWLQHCDAVLAYCEPPRNSGAVIALLRRR